MIFSDELVIKLKELYQAGNPYAMWLEWSITADPSWFKNRSFIQCYHSWIVTGKQEYLDLAKEELVMVPDGFQGNRNQLRQTGVYYTVCYNLIKPHLTQAQDAMWVARLTKMGQEMLDFCRVGDLDECITYWAAWELLDRSIGTSFMLATRGTKQQGELYWVGESTPAEAKEYTWRLFDEQDVEFPDASVEYYINNASLWCFIAAALGKESLPNFDKWLAGLSKYLLWSMSADRAVGHTHGDIQGYGAVSDTPRLYYRIPLMWMVIQLGGDPDGALANECVRITFGGNPVTHPYNLYPVLNHYPFFFFNPEILNGVDGKQPIKTGVYVNNSAGIVIHRTENSYCYANILNPKEDDHAYRGSFVDAFWRLDGEQILTRPGGYSIGGNEWYNHNGFAFKGEGWFWNRQFLDGHSTPNGFIASGRMTGPDQKFYYDTNTWGNENDFKDCIVDSDVEFNLAEKTFKFHHSWISPGNTFPERFAELPVMQQVIFSNFVPRRIDKGYEWTLASGKVVRATSDEAVDFEYIDKGHDFHAMHFKTAKDKFVGEMLVKVQLFDSIPTPEPEPTETNMKLKITWTPSDSPEATKQDLQIFKAGVVIFTQTLDNSISEFILDNIIPNTTYTVKIKAMNDSGNIQSETIEKSITSPQITINPPTNLVLEFI
jgi:hypothetical protein